MIRLTYLAVLLISCSADPRSPRIYNVLISSKKNLSPSHAQPVYEPVLRTTSIGYAFPSFYYHTSFVQNVPTTYINQDYSGFRKIDPPFVGQGEEALTNNIQYSKYAPQLPFDKDQSMNVVAQPQPPQYDPYALNYANYLPKEQEGAALNPNIAPATPQLGNAPVDPSRISQLGDATVNMRRIAGVPQLEEETDPKKVIANLKKNPEIPDVPPPPLPVKNVKSA